LEAEGKKPARRLAYMQRITPIAEIAKKDLEKIKDRKEIEEIMREIYAKKYADWTIKGIIVVITATPRDFNTVLNFMFL